MKVDISLNDWTTYKFDFFGATQDIGKHGGRVYYSRFNRIPKNTLYTIKDDSQLYFGIARCNVRDDVCVKQIGREMAYNRARDVQKRYGGQTPPALLIEADGNSGSCRIAASHIVKEYFYRLDREGEADEYEDDDKDFWAWWKAFKFKRSPKT